MEIKENAASESDIDEKDLSLRPGPASGELLQPWGNSCGIYGNNCGWAQKIGSCYNCLIRILEILSEMSRKDISTDGQESYSWEFVQKYRGNKLKSK